MKVVHLASEVAPFSKTGGLADVTGSLPPALAEAGLDVTVISPWYRDLEQAAADARTVARLRVSIPGHETRFELRELRDQGVNWWFIVQPELFDRDGIYGPPGADFPDNDTRYGLFCRAALAALAARDREPDVVHCHDWQTGPACLQLRDRAVRGGFTAPGTVFTIHNLGYQGNFPATSYDALGLEGEYFTPEWVEYFGKVSFLKAGLVAADRLTTVSPTYAREIQTEELGFGMDPVLRHRSAVLSGILNGIDTGYWNSRTDRFLPARFSASSSAGKQECKLALFRETGLTEPNRPLFGCVTRLADQKGVDLIVASIPALVAQGAKFCILGTGAPELHDALSGLQSRFPGSVAAILRFDEPLAHRVYAGSDFFLMPSRYEPCGLGQMIALRYGALPIATRTGGLADTVIDLDEHPRTGNGLLCERNSPDEFTKALARAVSLHGGSVHERARRRGMQADFSWDARAREYARLYDELVAARD